MRLWDYHILRVHVIEHKRCLGAPKCQPFFEIMAKHLGFSGHHYLEIAYDAALKPAHPPLITFLADDLNLLLKRHLRIPFHVAFNIYYLRQPVNLDPKAVNKKFC